MLLILIGYLFISLDALMSLGEGGMLLELPPDFLGYLLMSIGAGKLQEESRFFQKGKGFGYMAAGVSGFLFLLRLLSLSYAPMSVLISLEVAELVLMAVNVYLLISGLRELEQTKQLKLHGKTMWWLWIGLIVVMAVAYPGQMFPVIANITSLAMDLLCLILFVFFYMAHQALQEAREEQE